MQTSEMSPDRNQQAGMQKAWENLMDTATVDLFELLQQNVKWWEQAAVTCESSAANLPPGAKEELQLLGAIYRERARKFSPLIEGLRKNGQATNS